MMASNGSVISSGGEQHSQTTQTSLSSTALPTISANRAQTPQQLTVISTSLPSMTTTTVTNGRKGPAERQTNHRKAQVVVNRPNGIFEGSHIHFSPVDNKPLCSYSTKLCKQRRINGYAFCIRHILEDPSAPFRQCRHVAKYNQQKCSNAIPANEERLFCNSHMQIAGMAPKKERKDKKAGQQNSNQTNATNNSNNHSKCVSSLSVDSSLSVNTINERLLTNEKFTHFNAFIKPMVKLNGITNMVNNNQSNNTNNKTANHHKKSTDKSTTTAPTPLIETSFSSHTNNTNNFKLNHNSNPTSDLIKSKINNKNTNNKKPKRKKKEKKSIDKFVFARKKKSGDNLFNYHIWSESDDELQDTDDDRDQQKVNHCLKTITSDNEELFPLIFGTLSTNIVDLEANELKNELIAEKWLLKNLISVRKKDFAPQLESTRNVLKTLNRTAAKNYSYLDYKLAESARRTPESIRKGICCYTTDDSRCRLPSLPFTRHCIEHILYNVDQLLFSRCTAKCAQTMTQCSHSTFDITHEESLCNYHQLVGTELERPVSPTTDAKNKKRNKKKTMALTRSSRRKRKRGPNGTDIPSIIEDSIDSRLSIGSIDDDSLHSHSDTNDITINLLAQKDHNNSTDVIQHSITTSIPQTTTTTSIVAPELPLMRLPPLLPPTAVTTCASVVVPMSPVVMDHSVMPPPPPLEPTEEALVASIVADLPQLTNDADFTEVLNKIPDDAFSDFLLEHQNGEIPSTEETEALEQALAIVNKDVQNLVAVAGMNGNNSGAQLSDFGGQSDIIGFTNWLGSLTSEQRQQLNGLIDGAIASNSLSPILKNACEAYPQTIIHQPSSAPPIMKSSHTIGPLVNNTTNAFPIIYPINQISLAPTPPAQEFVPISAPVPLLNNNLLMNGLSPHPS